MTDREALYLKLPIPLQNLVCSVEGWRIQRSRFGSAFDALLQEAESRTLWPVERMQEYRNERLRAFIQHCAASVPFYGEWFKEHGLTPNDVRTPLDLQRLPILTKEQAQTHSARLVSEAVPPGERLITHTSGTTGGGLRFATTLRAIQEQWAVWWRYRRWHGLQPGTWCGYFGGRSVVPVAQSRPPFWRTNHPGRQILFSAYHMTPANLSAYVSELRRRRPPWLHGYPSLLALVAGHLLETGADLGYTPRWITTGAENLLPQQASLIARALGTRPRQHYGLSEGIANLSECEHGTLHVDEDFAATEFVPNAPGPGYRVVGTNFTNPATPFVRYDSQDVVELAGDGVTCPCGRAGRIVTRLDGRQEDYIVLKNGARLGRMDHIFKDMVHIREAQIHQRIPGALTIRVVRGEQYSAEDERALLNEARKRVGVETDIRLEYVERLERSRTGKLRFVVSEIPEGMVAALPQRALEN
jgi:phenylacetate-CoA ligase